METRGLAGVLFTLSLTVLYCGLAGAWCDFDRQAPHESRPCETWERPPASDHLAGFVVRRAGQGSPPDAEDSDRPLLLPQPNDSTGNFVGEYTSTLAWLFPECIVIVTAQDTRFCTRCTGVFAVHVRVRRTTV